MATQSWTWLTSCKIYVSRKWPAAIEISRDHAWTKANNQSLESKYPWGIPHIVIEALLSYDYGINIGERDRFERDKEKNKNK